MGRLTNIDDVRIMLLEISGFCNEMETMFSEDAFLPPSYIASADAIVASAHKDLQHLVKTIVNYHKDDK